MQKQVAANMARLSIRRDGLSNAWWRKQEKALYELCRKEIRVSHGIIEYRVVECGR